ncbi:MAG: VRR-NUC domain-containing protein [Parcubacteria group bacterium]|nr:VRR-NUC domain-containing protein [Parcubacteria group bacterium]
MGGEANLQRAILQLLALKQIPAWRVNTQGVPLHGPGREGRFRPSPNRGMADIIGILPDGRFFAIEVKSPRGKVTAEQEIFLGTIRAYGGSAIVARDIEKVVQWISQWISDVPHSAVPQVQCG